MWFSNVLFFPFSCVCFFINAIYIYIMIYVYIYNIHIPGTYTPIETGVRIITKVEIYPFAKVIPVIPCANWVVLLGLCLTWGWAGSGKVWGWPYVVSRVWKKYTWDFVGLGRDLDLNFRIWTSFYLLVSIKLSCPLLNSFVFQKQLLQSSFGIMHRFVFVAPSLSGKYYVSKLNLNVSGCPLLLGKKKGFRLCWRQLKSHGTHTLYQLRS